MRARAVLFIGWLCSCGMPDAGGESPSGETREGAPAADGGGIGPIPIGPARPFRACGPTGPTIWATEGQPIRLPLSCSTGLTPSGFEVSPLPDGARVVGSTFEWTPTLEQAGVYQLSVREGASGESGALKIGVADAFDQPANAPVDPVRYTEEYGLPVFHLFWTDGLARDSNTPGRVVYRGHTYEVLLEYRGRTSYEFPKKSFGIRFSDADEWSDLALGFGRTDKLVLLETFDDVSYVRPRLAFELWRRMSPHHLSPRTFSAVVFVNGQYWGLYVAIEPVDSDFVRRAGLRKDGNLYKAINADANFSFRDRYGALKSSLAQGFEKKEGLPAHGQSGAYDDIEAVTRWVESSTADELRSGVFARFSPEYGDWWIFVTLLLASDNTAKNAYHYRDPSGGPWRYVPWDLDATLGQDWQTRRTPATSRWEMTSANRLFARMLADPQLGAALRRRYRALLENELSVDTVVALVDRYAAEVREAALRDERKWQRQHQSYRLWADRTDFNDHLQEVDYLRRWIRERWSALSSRY